MKRGFTLIELTVVLAVIGLIIGGTMATVTAGAQQAAYNSTVMTLNAIDQALTNFANASGRLPCPSNPTVAPTSAYYGVEAGNTTPGPGVGSNASGSYVGECITGMTPAAYLGSGTTGEEGGVPTRTLRLPDSYMYDGWGRIIRYAVDPNYTLGINNTNSNTSAQIPNYICNTSSRGLTVYDSTGATRTTGAAYVLVSHGSTGHGAYTTYGGTTLFNAKNSNTDVLKNCSCNSGATPGSYNNAYTQATPYYTSGHTGNAAYFFDDIVSFKEPWQLVNQYNSVSAKVNCSSAGGNIWYSDPGTCTVTEITKSGAWVMTLGTANSCGNTNSKFNNPSPPTIDKYGNIWIPDSTNNRIVEFSSSGTFMHSYGSYGTTGGLFAANGSSMQIAFDNSASPPNLWVTDLNNNRIQEFTYSSGAFNSAVYAYKTSITVQSGANKVLPTGLAITQISGVTTLWVNVQGSSSPVQCGVYLCNTSGTCNQATGVTCGSGATQFAKSNFNPSNYLTIDASGNVWSVDEDNSTIYKFNSSGTYTGTNLSITSNPGGTTGTVFDSTGNPWLSSEQNNEILRINATTGAQIGSAITTVNGLALQYPQMSNNYTYNTTR